MASTLTHFTRRTVFPGVLVLLLVCMISAGCARMRRGAVVSQGPDADASKEAETLGALYHDFEDVLFPIELKMDKKRSFVIRTPGFTAGVLVLTGRIEINSLVRFFENNMAKDNWQLLSFFKSPRTIMFLNKTDRSCIINMTEKRFKTDVEIWLLPHTQQPYEAQKRGHINMGSFR